MAGKGLTAEKVVVAATALADRRGYEQMSLAAVAVELGVRVPSLYKHIDGLADLRRRVAELAAAEVADEVGRLLRTYDGRDAFIVMARRARAYALQYPGRYAAFCRHPQASAQLPDAANPVAQMTGVLREMGLGEREANATILAVRCALRGFATFEMSGAADAPEDIDAAFERLIDMVDRAVTTAAIDRELQSQFDRLPVHGR
jgi:AcrR family transcriptional regulator